MKQFQKCSNLIILISIFSKIIFSIKSTRMVLLLEDGTKTMRVKLQVS